MIKQKAVAGVLGGMGPEATIDFMSRVLLKTQASVDQEHIKLLIDHNPKVPNRHAAIQGDREDVGAELAQMARGLERSGADFLVMVCNTAHAFHEDIEAAVSIPFVSMIDEVINVLKRDWSDNTKVGVMAAEGCLQAELYQRALHDAGYQAIVWDGPQLTQFMDLIYQIKAGEMGQRVGLEMASLAEGLVQRGAEVVLIACTEIPLALNAESLSVPFIESTDVLAARVVNYSLGGAEVPAKRN